MGVVSFIIIVVTSLVSIVLIGYIISIYNGIVRLKLNIEKAWSNIDVLLKQRTDELPNLILAVKGYMKHEKNVMKEVTDARAAAVGAGSVHAKAAADNILGSALKSLFAVSENYPQLKANENFMRLQKRISAIEDQIADRREFYNDSVTTYNTRIQQVPYIIIAKLFNYHEKELFRADAKGMKGAVKLSINAT